jgi:hypothetical protein
VHPECCGISYFSKALKGLADRIGEYDLINAGHGYVNSPAKCVSDCYSAVQDVIRDPYAYDLAQETPKGTVYIKSGGLSDVIYQPEEVIVNLEKYG